MQTLEYQLEKINDKLVELEKPAASFSEAFDNVPQFNEGFKDLGLMAAGGAIAPLASQIINKYIPVGNLGSALVGMGLKFIVKNNTVQRVADGMIVASLSMFISNLLAGKLGFGEGISTNRDDNVAFSEQRVGGVNFG